MGFIAVRIADRQGTYFVEVNYGGMLAAFFLIRFDEVHKLGDAAFFSVEAYLVYYIVWNFYYLLLNDLTNITSGYPAIYFPSIPGKH